MDPKQEHTWPGLEQLGSEKRDLADEAMYRSLKSKLFAEEHPPVQLGRFRVVRTLGQGGMGVVYAAEDVQLGRQVAVKVIRDDRLREGARDRLRLLREAQMQAKLAHPNVVPIHEVSEFDGALFIVMELVEGTTLREWLDREPRPLPAILERFVEAGRGLAAAHRLGIVHRDFKLANALVGEDGRVRIADFGLAVADHSHQDTQPDPSASPATDGTTSKFAGTPAYMSPEQVRGKPCDARSDQYSFAVALHEAVFGRTPPPALERLAEKTGGALTLPAEPSAPQWLRQALTRALALDPAARWPSMAALVEVLVETPKRRRRRALAVGLVAALAGATVLGATIFRQSSESQCLAVGTPITETWNDEQRQKLLDAFTSTGLSYAERTWQRASTGLDAYVSQWSKVADENCRADLPRTQQSEALLQRSFACLEGRRSEVATLLEALATEGASFVADAESLVARLPDPSQCRLITLRNTIDPAERLDPRVRNFLDRAKMFTSTHQGRMAATLLEGALSAIRSDGNGNGEAEALLLLGKAQGQLLSDGRGAVDSLNLAYDQTPSDLRPTLMWQIWSEMARVHAVELDAPAAARTYLDHAKAERPRNVRLTDAALATVESEILIAEDRAAEAVEKRRAALTLLQSQLPAKHPDVILARLKLASSLGEAHKVEEARALHEQLLAELRDDFGSDHPWPARVELNLGMDLRELERPVEAREHLERARSALVATYGEVHLWVAKADVLLAQLDFDENALDQAVARLERALATYDSLVPRGHAERIMVLAELSNIFAIQSRCDRVLVFTRELLEIYGANTTRQNLDLPGQLTNIGDCLCELGRCPEALPYFSRLMTLYVDESMPEPALRAVPLRGIGLVHLAQDKPELALVFLEQALAILEGAPHERLGLTLTLAATMRELADALVATRRGGERVRRLRARAAEIEAAL